MSPILRAGSWIFGWFAAGALLVLLLYQVPARHTVSVGHDDEPYVQGFGEATNRWGVVTDRTGVTGPYRWTSPDSVLIFPQIGLPARATLRLRAWLPPDAQPPRVRVLLNGREELDAFVATRDWEEHSFTFRSGLAKPRDLFLQIHVEPPVTVDGEQRGVQIDHAVLATAGWPILPYPAQLLGGGVATLLAALALRRPRRIVLGMSVMGLLFLGVYRLQISPYPIRGLWLWLIALWLGILVLQVAEQHQGSSSARVFPAWPITWARVPGILAGAALLIWVILMWRASQAHVVLSLPGVEKDFRVFATRSEQLWCPAGIDLVDAGCVMRADGFYQLGYPFLLWLLRPFALDNAFLAARVAALGSGVLILVATYGLGRRLLGGFGALVALLLVLLNRWTSEYSLLLGTDMPFAAAWILALLALVAVRRSRWRAFGAGLLCGTAFMIRHPGILLLLLGAGFLLWPGDLPRVGARHTWRRWRWDLAGMLVAGWLLISGPQLLVNVAQQGSLFYSQQAKNIWLAVYGNTDWGRWSEASNDVTLREVVAQAPMRFVGNWWSNIRGFWGAGSEDTSEFGRAVAIRLLTFPANLLAFAGLGWWLVRGSRHERFILLAAVVYITSVAVGFLLPRFALPFVPIWALAAATAVCRLWWWMRRDMSDVLARPRLLLGTGLAMVLLMAGAPGAGSRLVLDHQDRAEEEAVALIRRSLHHGDRFSAHLPPTDFVHKYSAIAHLVAAPGKPARFVLWSEAAGQPAPPFPLVGRAGRYALYRLED